ncbi:MAG TPA: Gfo/Idh/MocA family oxidoreductase [Candidatus Latescibacteria bacterium]|nr:oxidoreductase [Gemmatimonadaceae bacterium]MDP6014582.1 Gfo/Idh/MocA family oxidoreductase [Candidatus Latescibacterota bacterium]HJP30170.1 Gfo/Idh/MocA family oxidoreductase [Candidatus Latescibacterota bacterium]
MAGKVRIGLIGCGNISPQYIRWCRTFEIIDLVACADIDTDLAQARAEEFEVAGGCSVDELLADAGIEIVVNLTVPKVHASVNRQILEAGKHAHTEKPFAVDKAEGRAVLDLAQEKGLRTGSAPDTFLGGGIQTCRKLIDDGWIGEPVAASAFMAGRGPEGWHPNPDFFYKPGGGPMFDMGPYYLTALVSLLGPVRRVTGSARASFPQRVITNPERRTGERIEVETPTHISGVLDFAGGAVGTVVTSFDVWSHNLPRIEIYGSEGSLSVPDPNTFDGPVRLRRAGQDDWQEVPLTHSVEVGRGIGVADMAYGLRSGRPHRASGELAYHVLELMHAFGEASDRASHVEIESQVERPAALPMGLRAGTLDE